MNAPATSLPFPAESKGALFSGLRRQFAYAMGDKSFPATMTEEERKANSIRPAMTFKEVSGPAASLNLTREQVDEIQAAFDKIRDDVLADLNEKDAAHIRNVIKRARTSAVIGRSLLMFGLDPITFVIGAVALGYAKILENMEIGHNVMHGQYDWMNDPYINSMTYDWDSVCSQENWHHFHNYEHHTYTNIAGKDRDLGYTLLRLSEQQPWVEEYRHQKITNAVLAVLFEWGVALHDMRIDDIRFNECTPYELNERMKPFYAKSKKQLFKDYVLFPLLAGPNAPRVLAGNFAANIIRNMWAYTIIFCGHFTEGVSVWTEEQTANETRGDWYIRQLLGSSNLEGSKFFYILTGHLSHQIEHHLFPDLPAPRYNEIKPKVQEICRKYGMPYNTGSLRKQYGEVLRRINKYSKPPADAVTA